ncbi:MAG: methyltransferase domain-containing protein [Candidatus Latescibacteria bacterium]|nr:methyltransferase domain-containing protein [Candidatus Latescibacterota bacterium]
MDQARAKWEARYAAAEYIHGTAPVPFLVEQLPHLKKGRALCLAAGEGRNAVFLARQGFAVTAIDIAQSALDKCRALADQYQLELQTVRADLSDFDLGRDRWELVTNLFYLQRDLFPRAMEALTPGGHFLVQTYSIDQPAQGFGPSNPDFLLKPGELLAAFAPYRIRYYQDGLVAAPDEGGNRQAAVIRLVVEK